MRNELQDFEEYFWDLTKDDFKITADLVKEFMKGYWKEIKLPKENKTVTPEIDLFIAQHYRETQFLIQFGVWRLQSIFESLLKTNFAVQTRNGIRTIISLLKKKGYTSYWRRYAASLCEVAYLCLEKYIKQLKYPTL